MRTERINENVIGTDKNIEKSAKGVLTIAL